MTRFAASTLDLSRLPPPQVVKALSFERILAERLADLKDRFAAADIDYDVGGLETDPVAILSQEDAFRELLDLGAINDAARGVMVAFAVGADLDQLAAFYGIRRRVIQPATDEVAAVMESDRELRRRVQVAPEAFGVAGSAGSYIHHALEVAPDLMDVAPLSPAPGRIDVILLSRGASGIPSLAVRDAVRVRLHAKDIKPLAAEVTVRAAEPVPYEIVLRALVKLGPDPSVIRSAAKAALVLMAAERRRIGEEVPLSAIYAAAHVAGVDRIEIDAPAGDVAVAPDQFPHVVGIAVTTEVADG